MVKKIEVPENPRDLLLYILDSFGERTTYPIDYKPILQSLKPYTQHTGPIVKQHLAKALAVVRNKNQEQLDSFLDEAEISQQLKEVIIRLSFDEPLTELAHRLHELIAAFLVYSDPQTVQRVIASARIVLQSGSIDAALEATLKEELNAIIGENVFAH